FPCWIPVKVDTKNFKALQKALRSSQMLSFFPQNPRAQHPRLCRLFWLSCILKHDIQELQGLLILTDMPKSSGGARIELQCLVIIHILLTIIPGVLLQEGNGVEVESRSYAVRTVLRRVLGCCNNRTSKRCSDGKLFSQQIGRLANM